MLDRLYYWLDLYGRDGRPANTKVLHAIGLALAWVVVALVAWRMEELGSDFVLLVLAALAATGGPDTLKAFFKSRAGGMADVLRERERQRADVIRAANEPDRFTDDERGTDAR